MTSDKSRILDRLPGRTRHYENVRVDSSRWDYYVPREGDVVIATYPKCGTTWMEQIVLNLIHRGDEKPSIHDVGIWLDRKHRRESKDDILFPVEDLVAKLDAQSHRRQIKTHLPLDFLPFYPQVTYVVVVRPNRDCWLSWHNHYRNWLQQDTLPEDPREFWTDWIEGRVAPQSGWDDRTKIHPHFLYYWKWWPYRDLDNVHLVHFNDMLVDLASEVRQVAEHLQIDVSGETVEQVVNASTFESMKANADRLLPGAKRADVFLNQGTNERWRGLLGKSDLVMYRQAVERAIESGVDRECMEWSEREPQTST